MTRYQFLFLTGTLVVCACGFVIPAVKSSSKDRRSFIDERLAVQNAWCQGKQHLTQGDSAKAIQVLEEQLPRIDGDRKYLLLLRDAYKSHVTNLYLNNQNELAQTYLRRLQILDPQAAKELALRPESGLTTAASSAGEKSQPLANSKAKDHLPTAKPPLPKPVKDSLAVAPVGMTNPKEPNKPKFRANDGVIDPFSKDNAIDDNKPAAENRLARELISRAEEKFRLRLYEQARHYYNQAYNADHKVISDSADRWAYCKLDYVVKELNNGAKQNAALAFLEREVKAALTLSPRLKKVGATLLDQINAKRQAASANVPNAHVPAQALNVKHQNGQTGSWKIAETDHFRVFHHQSREFAEQAARAAESTRTRMIDKWFGGRFQAWRRKCDIYLHDTARDYSKATGISPLSPGHSRTETDSTTGAIVSLRMDLHCQNKDLMTAVLPHETTHVVLAGQFGKSQPPRWVDEGIAVLSEPSDKIESHLDNLDRVASNRELFALKELIQLQDYPHRRRIRAFYAQSVSVVDFLSSRQGGPRRFTQFVNDGLAKGFEAALRQHYGYRSFSDLDATWSRAALSDGQGIAQK